MELHHQPQNDGATGLTISTNNLELVLGWPLCTVSENLFCLIGSDSRILYNVIHTNVYIMLITQPQLAIKCNISIPTINQMVSKGVLPAPDVQAGRERYFSAAVAERIRRFFDEEYRRYRRYPEGHVRLGDSEKATAS